jgi:hypothetical protein
MPSGTYKSVCKIPANLFNSLWVYLSINLFSKDFSDEKMIPEILKLEILDGAFVRGDYYGYCGGYFRPLLRWNTLKL